MAAISSEDSEKLAAPGSEIGQAEIKSKTLSESSSGGIVKTAMLAGVLATCLIGLGQLTAWVWRKFRSPKKDLKTRSRGMVGEELNIVSDSDGC